MPTAPTLTIGLPVFNGAPFLQATIDSVLSQSFCDFELLISDNASTDETETIGREAAAGDRRVTYRRNATNVGLVRNLNLLVPSARGRLFKWAAADDILRPGYLERCVATIDADPAVVLAYPQTEFVDGEGAPLDLDDPGLAPRLGRSVRAPAVRDPRRAVRERNPRRHPDRRAPADAADRPVRGRRLPAARRAVGHGQVRRDP